MDCIVHGVAKSRIGLSDFHFQELKNKSRILRLCDWENGHTFNITSEGKKGGRTDLEEDDEWVLESRRLVC